MSVAEYFSVFPLSKYFVVKLPPDLVLIRMLAKRFRSLLGESKKMLKEI
jgi:hypothetical protein